MKKGLPISLRVLLGLVILVIFMFPIAIVHSGCIDIGSPFENGGLDITGMHFISLDEGWAVGYDTLSKEGILLHCSNSVWSFVEPPEVSTDWTLNGVYSISSDEGWAVGHDRSNKTGVLLHNDKGAWTVVNPPDVSSDWRLNVVLFTSADEGWAGGYDNSNERGILLRYSKGSWILDSDHLTVPRRFESLVPTAASSAPSVTTGSYNLTSNSAKLNGSLNLYGSPGNWWFEVNGTAIIYHSVPFPSNSSFAVSETISVNPNTSYSYRVCANNASGQQCGELKRFEISGGPKAATPTFSPGPGPWAVYSMKVTILCATTGATIRYTTDGSDPTSGSSLYSSPLTFTSTTTLKAKAFKSGVTDSDVASGTYTIGVAKVATPTFSPGPGPWAVYSMKVTILCATTGATIRYTTDGSDPTSGSSLYSSPLTFTFTTTLKAKAFKSGMTDSDVASGTYTFGVAKVVTPTFIPAPGTYTGSVIVTILCATNGATIRYTTNGSNPTSGSSLYSSPLTFTSTTTLKAKAFKSGMTDSDVASGTYTKK